MSVAPCVTRSRCMGVQPNAVAVRQWWRGNSPVIRPNREEPVSGRRPERGIPSVGAGRRWATRSLSAYFATELAARKQEDHTAAVSQMWGQWAETHRKKHGREWHAFAAAVAKVWGPAWLELGWITLGKSDSTLPAPGSVSADHLAAVSALFRRTRWGAIQGAPTQWAIATAVAATGRSSWWRRLLSSVARAGGFRSGWAPRPKNRALAEELQRIRHASSASESSWAVALAGAAALYGQPRWLHWVGRYAGWKGGVQKEAAIRALRERVIHVLDARCIARFQSWGFTENRFRTGSSPMTPLAQAVWDADVSRMAAWSEPDPLAVWESKALGVRVAQAIDHQCTLNRDPEVWMEWCAEVLGKDWPVVLWDRKEGEAHLRRWVNEGKTWAGKLLAQSEAFGLYATLPIPVAAPAARRL